jgi:hypothetical protein
MVLKDLDFGLLRIKDMDNWTKNGFEDYWMIAVYWFFMDG